jgi:hypothetical protein
MKTKLSVFVLAALLAGRSANAQMMLQKAVIASGGGISSGLILKSNITVGQAIVGTASNATQKAQLGFWTSAASKPSQGVSETAQAMELSIQTWPNPASKDCKVVVNSQASDIDIRLFDLTGKEVKTIYNGPGGSSPHSFNVSDLAAGSYIIAARSPGQLVEKLISVVR